MTVKVYNKMHADFVHSRRQIEAKHTTENNLSFAMRTRAKRTFLSRAATLSSRILPRLFVVVFGLVSENSE